MIKGSISADAPTQWTVDSKLTDAEPRTPYVWLPLTSPKVCFFKTKPSYIHLTMEA